MRHARTDRNGGRLRETYMAKRLLILASTLAYLLTIGGSAVLAVGHFPPCVPGWGC
jgi:hypothetical protein